MRLGNRDKKLYLLITGKELVELKRHTWLMAEAYGLDARIERYQGKRPMGFHRWDLDCLIDSIFVALTDDKEYPSKDSKEYQMLSRLHQRLKDEYAKAFD